MTQNQIATKEDIQQLRDEYQEMKELILLLTKKIQENTTPKTYIKGKELRKRLGNMSEGCLTTKRRRREIPYHDLNPGILYNYEEIVALMEANKIPAITK